MSLPRHYDWSVQSMNLPRHFDWSVQSTRNGEIP